VSDELAPRRTQLPGPAAASALASGEAEGDILHEVLAFSLADETYALPLASVKEILKLPALTEVPRSPADVLGIISVRGRITTVIDLRRRLRMPESPPTKLTRILLVDDGREILGLLVDSVISVYRLRSDEVELSAVAGAESEHVMGIGRPKASRASRAEEVAGTVDDLLILLSPEPLLRR